MNFAAGAKLKDIAIAKKIKVNEAKKNLCPIVHIVRLRKGHQQPKNNLEYIWRVVTSCIKRLYANLRID